MSLDSTKCLQPNQTWTSFIFCSHGADVRVEAGEDDASLSSFLQNAGQDDVEIGVHVEVG